ncbi:unnamed protein product, partial [Ectocarpus sp. 4 AP-2014]
LILLVVVGAAFLPLPCCITSAASSLLFGVFVHQERSGEPQRLRLACACVCFVPLGRCCLRCVLYSRGCFSCNCCCCCRCCCCNCYFGCSCCALFVPSRPQPNTREMRSIGPDDEP